MTKARLINCLRNIAGKNSETSAGNSDDIFRDGYAVGYANGVNELATLAEVALTGKAP